MRRDAMKRILLLLVLAAIGTLAVSAYRDRPDGIFAWFKDWARPWVDDARRSVADKLRGAASDVTAMVAGLLDESKCSFTCDYGAGGSGARRTIHTEAPDSNGLRAVGEIMAEAGLKPNFKVLSGDVANASAFVHEGERVIVYNRAWVAELTQSAASKWAIYAVLAHEIGHHLNGDTMPRAGSYADRAAAKNHEQELAADYFAGFVLAKLGAGLDDTLAAVRKYGGDETSTHPGRDRRVAEHTTGWNKGHVDAAPARPVSLSADMVRLQQQLGRHAEHYGPGHVVVDGRSVPCLVQYRLLFAGAVMKVKGIRYDALSRDIAIVEWQLDPRDGRPHPVSAQATGVIDGAACHRVTVANAGEFCYSVAPAERRERDPAEFVRLLERYVELGAR